MLRLSTFGGVAVTRDGRGVVGAASGRRHLALLALLAAAGERGISRAALAAMLWPDSPPEAGRHSLHQALYALRRALDADDLFGGTAAVHLDGRVMPSDVAEFAAATRSGDHERAVALYAGPFADGLVFDDHSEAERRVDALRTGYARDFAHVLSALADAAAAHDDRAAQLRWLRRLADAEPLSAAPARRLVAALVESGEPAAALQHALVHEARVRQALGAPPDPELARWVQRLRAGGTGANGRGPAGDVGSGSAMGAAVGAAFLMADRRAAHLSEALTPRYAVDRLLETGGITACYAGTTANGARVDVHVVQPQVAAGVRAEGFVGALRRAGRVAAAEVLPTLDVGAADGLLFFVTAERVRPSLRERLKREGALPIADAVAIGRGMAAALAAAHACGVCHGDLRPKHVGLGASGAVVVSGFGVAEGLAAEGRGDDAGSTVVALGSPAYLSPERLAGGARPDARGDVYAFGCVLYEMLAGEPPFGRRGSALGAGMAREPPPIRGVRERVPEALAEVVHACLARVPADRYPSARELSTALDRAALATGGPSEFRSS